MKANCPVCGKSIGHDGAVEAYSNLPRPTPDSPERAEEDEPFTKEALHELHELTAGLESAVFSIMEIIFLSGRSSFLAVLLEFMRSVPRKAQPLDDVDPASMFGRYLSDANRLNRGPRLTEAIRAITRFSELDEPTRMAAEGIIASVLIGYMTGGSKA